MAHQGPTDARFGTKIVYKPAAVAIGRGRWRLVLVGRTG
jgi:hypothetical protein